ncbi:hypothetical protein ACGCUQ_05435 [Eubacteriales bacterium KG127]
MKSPKIQVLKGGAKDTANSSEKIFKSAYVTDTRLMGVLSVGITWELPENQYHKALHQFFYIDVEDFGLERYTSLLGDDDNAYVDIQRSFIGGLGCRLVEISLREAMWLLQKYAGRALTNNYKLPEPISEYAFLLTKPVIFTDPEMYILDSKQCTPISTPYEAINYYLMRQFAKDFEAAAVLATSPEVTDCFPDLAEGVLYNNKITKLSEENLFSCESLVESGNYYYITVSHVKMEQLRVAHVDKVSSFPLPTSEAARLLSREEHISIMRVDEDFKHFNQNGTFMLNWSTVCREGYGRLYVLYKPDNNHVNSHDYSMLNDFYGVYYFNGDDELVLMANSDKYLGLLEHDIFNSSFGKHVSLVHKQVYPTPLLYDFVKSREKYFLDYAD